MHIALLTLSFPPQTGGVQTYLSQICRRMARQHEISVVTPVPYDSAVPDNFRRISPRPTNLIGFSRALRQLGPDRIVVGHAHPQLLLPAALHRRAPYMAIAYGNDYLAAQVRWHRHFFNRLLSRAHPLVTITKDNAQRLSRIGAGEAQIVYPGANPTHFRPGDWSPERARILLTVSRLVPRKGIDTVLQALPALRRRYPDIAYWIAGSGPDRGRLETLVTALQLDESVRFLGRVPDAELPDLYRRAGIFVMPVREEEGGKSVEGFGIVYLEASASGLPVVAGRSGGASEAVRHGETGLVVEPQPHTVASALAHLLDDPELCVSLGEAGRRRVEAEMHWDRAARDIQEALRS